ncbi:histidine kinase [Bacteroidia bacterium]|nr:histidine kinase [Bacteroidia bacterium]
MKLLVPKILFIILIGYSKSIQAQQVVKHFTIEDGLPSNEVYFVHQDKSGYLWFCTDRGVSRYNGYEFTNFTTADGLTNNTVFKCFEDWDGNIWFTCIDGSVTIFDSKKKQFGEYKHDAWLKTKFTKQLWIHNIGFRKEFKEVYFFRTKSDSVQRINSGGQKVTLSKEEVLNSGDLGYDNFQILDYYNREEERGFWHFYYSTEDDKSRKGIEELLNLPDSVIMPSFVFYQSDSNLVVCQNNGFYIVKRDGSNEQMLKGIGSLSFVKDREGFYWITTKYNGVFLLSNNNLISFDLKNKLKTNEKLYSGYELKGRLVLTTVPNGVFILDIEKPKVLNQMFYGGAKIIRYLLYDNDSTSLSYRDLRISGMDSTLYLNLDNQSEKNIKALLDLLEEYKHTIPNYALRKEYFRSRILNVGTSYGCSFVEWVLKNNKLSDHLNLQVHGLLRNYFECEEYLYMESHLGLKKVYADSRPTEIVNLGDEFESIGISDLDTINKVTLLATKGHGVITVKDDSVLVNLRKNNGLLSDVINTLYVDRKSSQIWFGTDKGISIFSFSLGKKSLSFKWERNIKQIDGLISKYVNDLEIVQDKMISISNKGITVIPKDFAYDQSYSPAVCLKGLQNGDSTYLSENEVFSHAQNNIEFHYEVISMRKGLKTYQYRLIKNGNTYTSDWNLTDDRTVKINNLSPGNYKFQVSARAANTTWSYPKEYTFTIQPRFIDQWWVRGIMILFLGVMTYLFFKKREVRLKRESKLALAIKELELENSQLESSSLRGQMSPHFVFNVLNSIQKLILKEEKDDANKLLIRFSRLVRSALKYSRFEFIPIEDELAFLENYINIEHQRFRGRFKYEIFVDKELMEYGVKIPPLLIQPLCENAIKHAFLEDGGTLKVFFIYKDDNLMEVIVEDDGVGMLNMTQSKESSLGIRIIEDRLRLFEANGCNISLKIKYADIETKKGTKAVIVMPYQ